MHQQLWAPSIARIESSNLSRYQKFLRERKNLHFSSYEELRVWSVKDVGVFWESIWEFSEVVHSKKYETPYRIGRNFTDSRYFFGSQTQFCRESAPKDRFLPSFDL
ncbi:hypothetical protein LEP1GSC133_0995 [Leptospira borgpetersenii serovar Pomona str. 200901868]|uniref:Acetyl-coenzyme A synthetase N-terminal domain-containing protein n=1 Tax=Leptospira borgpetersenii serovar Pomona str. 200901868 TaxID=1192866 RepID=M6WFT2_LEPBO|nr:hypothetical protein LEP1GSC133_0995 [Leptospira borgpetersenii serovar Pomona str. 200901868]